MSIRAKPGLLAGADGASASVGGGVSSSGSGATKTGEVSDAGSVSSETIVAVLIERLGELGGTRVDRRPCT